MGREAIVREILDALMESVDKFGNVNVCAQKTRIVFQVRTRFASVVIRNRWLILKIWLQRQAGHPTLQRIEKYTQRDFGHILRLKAPGEIDDGLVNLMREAYTLGSG